VNLSEFRPFWEHLCHHCIEQLGSSFLLMIGEGTVFLPGDVEIFEAFEI
jgi:hypothetical protein